MSAVPEGKYVEIFDGYRVHYHEYGEGPAVIFVHGSGPGASGWSNFRLNAPEIAAAGFRCLVPDMLGYGYSSITETPTFTYKDLVRGIVEFAAAVGAEDYTLVGNSMGGAVAITIGLEHPERVRNLVLMAPGGLEDR
ncbi:MAG: alpha/beta fold hydrolase, partial [Candidatus Dadabacteria bacterium]